LGVDTKWESSGQAVQDLSHVAQDKAILFHIALAHVLWESGACRLLVDKVADGLDTIADGQGFVLKELGRFLALLDQILAGEFSKRFAGLIGLPHIELNHPSGDLSDLGDRFTGIEVNHIEGV
jgi:hypothetical protein